MKENAIRKKEVLVFQGEPRKKKGAVKLAGLFLGLFLIYYSFSRRVPLSFFLGLLLMLASYLEKSYQVDSRGARIIYRVGPKHFEDLWSWDEISSLHSVKKDEFSEFHFSKGAMTRVFPMKSTERKEIFKLAKEKNKRIILGEA